MKILKLLLTIGLIHVANAAFATGAYVTSGSSGGSGAGTGVLSVVGENGTYSYAVSTNVVYDSGDISDPTAVDDVETVVVVSAAGYKASYHASCTFVIPEGETGTATYNASYGTNSTALLSITDVCTISSGSGTVTLEPGTYTLSTSASATTNSGTGTAQITVHIAYDE